MLASRQGGVDAPRHSGTLTFAITAFLAVFMSIGVGGKSFAQQAPWTQPVPRANCGAADRVEPGLQGQTSLVDRMSGANQTPYNCNMDLVGNFAGEGAEWQMAWFKDCAYYDTNDVAQQTVRGSPVIDVSNPANPQATAYLDDPSFAEPWESLKVHDRRQLLASAQANNGGGSAPGFAIYDVSKDCKHPQLLFSGNIDVTPGGVRGHAGQFSTDGMTYWGAVIGGAIYPLDVADPTHPKLLAKFNPGTCVGCTAGDASPHDVSTNDDGTRLYIANLGANKNGLAIVDVSDVQNRLPNPKMKLVGTYYWPDGGRTAQQPTPIRIKGRPYILFADENSTRLNGCASGNQPFGMGRLIDILDETHPKLVSYLMLEVNQANSPDNPTRCQTQFQDFISTGGFLYDAHYCTADDPKNAKMVACSYMQAGVRIFDVRNPYAPKELAYYKPPATGRAFRPGSTLWTPTANLTHDLSSSNVRFLRKDGQVYIWFTSHNNGFHVAKLSEHLRSIDPDLFAPGTKGATGNTQPY
jgi:hypothetical protein